MSNNVEVIRDFYGRILGYIEEQPNGDATGRDFYRRIVGKYIKSLNQTRDFYGKVVGKGNQLSALIYKANNK